MLFFKIIGVYNCLCFLLLVLVKGLIKFLKLVVYSIRLVLVGSLNLLNLKFNDLVFFELIWSF